jgi:hypothetical protein
MKPILRWTSLLCALCLQSVQALEIASFRAEVTPRMGAALCGGLVKPAEAVDQPLYALGLVLWDGQREPVVLCAVDYCEIRGEDHRRWRQAIGQAAGCDAQRVTLHSLHQHNAPLLDSAVQSLLPDLAVVDRSDCDAALQRITQAVSHSLSQRRQVSHLMVGEAAVQQVAGNRRVDLKDGKVGLMRGSASKDARLRALPEGLIDPMLKSVAFFDGTQKLATLHYYATHPMSYYGDGRISHDFVGMAREQCSREDQSLHIYFTGCGGNIGAGKYNDGNPQTRPLLAQRLHQAMRLAQQQAKRLPAGPMLWRHEPLSLDKHPDFPAARMQAVLENPKAAASARIVAALRLVFVQSKAALDLSALHLGSGLCLLHLPGESFVEYQLHAQSLRPGAVVATASYADGITGYIPTEAAFAQGGYETTQAYAAPASEGRLRAAIARLLAPAP